MNALRSASLLLASLPLLCAQPDRFATPACSGPDRELATRSSYLACYSHTLRAPIWTAYQLTPESLHGAARRPSHFHRDLALSGPTASDTDFRNSGFNRGHLVPAEDAAFSDAAIADTFLFTNVVPQSPASNNGQWRQLENAVRTLAAHADAIYVITGPIYGPNPESIGPDRIPVPAYLFKVILVLQGSTKTMYAAILPNGPKIDWEQANTTVQNVEQQTTLDFFSALDDTEERRLESERHIFPVTPVRDLYSPCFH